MKFLKNTRKDRQIFLVVIPCATMLFNYMFFGKKYFTDVNTFFFASLVTFAIISCMWPLYTWIAVTIRMRFSRGHDLHKHIWLAILIIILVSWLALTLMFFGYAYFNFLGYELNETRYKWALIICAGINICVTLFMEGIFGFERWNDTLSEAHQIKLESAERELMALKNPITINFLYNCLESLSTIISKNPETADKFLNEMSKICRYQLQNNAVRLVFLNDELGFITSYFYLLSAHFGNTMKLTVQINESDHYKMIPPLTFQLLLETVFHLNKTNKSTAFRVTITSQEDNWIEFKSDFEMSLEQTPVYEENVLTMLEKLEKLSHRSAMMKRSATGYTVQIPLMQMEKLKQHVQAKS